MLRDHLDQHDHDFVFTSLHYHWLRRSDYDRRVFRPSVDGTLHLRNPAVPLEPVDRD